MIRIVVLVVLWAASANAAPPSRVLVADSDPELVRAIDKSLAPWRITVISEPTVPDGAHAHARADAVDAQFIVWREGDQLVVFDRERGTSEKRTARAGAFDPVEAAAAALTVKTMMRLPAEPTGDGSTGANAIVVPAVPAASTGPELRMQIGVGARVASGSQTDVGGRALLMVLVRPTTSLGLRLGVAADLGTSSEVSKSGFKGTFGDWALLGVASWSWRLGRFEVAPAIGAGFSRSRLDGELSMVESTDTETVGILRGGVSVRWPLGWWSLGASLDADLFVGTQTYMKAQGMGNPSTVFETPGSSVVVGVFAAIDLGL